MEKIRLQKYISECGILSRRAAEAEIIAGNVRVNGVIASLGDKVDPENDTVEVNGTVLEKNDGGKRRHTYILLNKPSGYVTTLSDEKGRKTVAELISDAGKRLYPVGRLDMYSDGLLLCTDDGELTNRITHPSHHISKQYLATITSHLSEDDIRKLAVPFEIDGYMLKPYDVAFVKYTRSSAAPSTVISFTLYEGRNREIRKICAHYGYKLSKLTRIRIGELTLSDLPVGKWRYLTEDEIEYLKTI